VTGSEQCDDGNLIAGDCCSPSCHFEPIVQSCNDQSACTQSDHCDGAGKCGGTTMVTCQPLDGCHLAGTCDAVSGACSNPAKPDGAGCDDPDACTTGQTCQAGICGAPTSIKSCSAQDDCHRAGRCDSTTAVCSN